jgi:hypothetical protein
VSLIHACVRAKRADPTAHELNVSDHSLSTLVENGFGALIFQRTFGWAQNSHVKAELVLKLKRRLVCNLDAILVNGKSSNDSGIGANHPSTLILVLVLEIAIEKRADTNQDSAKEENYGDWDIHPNANVVNFSRRWFSRVSGAVNA